MKEGGGERDRRGRKRAEGRMGRHRRTTSMDVNLDLPVANRTYLGHWPPSASRVLYFRKGKILTISHRVGMDWMLRVAKLSIPDPRSPFHNMEQPPGKYVLNPSLPARYGLGTSPHPRPKGCGRMYSGPRPGQDASAEHVCSMSSFPSHWLGADATEAPVYDGTTRREEPESLSHCVEESPSPLGTLNGLLQEGEIPCEPLRVQSLFVTAADTLLRQRARVQNIIINNAHLKGARQGAVQHTCF